MKYFLAVIRSTYMSLELVDTAFNSKYVSSLPPEADLPLARNANVAYLGWLMGLEPTTSASTGRRSTSELQPPRQGLYRKNYTILLLSV